MANTGILLRKQTKYELTQEPPISGEIVLASDTNEIGMLLNGEIFWQEWNENFTPPFLLTGWKLPEDSQFSESDKYIRVWHNGVFPQITEFKKENDKWRELAEGVSENWVVDNIEPNFHNISNFPYLGKYSLTMNPDYTPTEQLDISTLGYVLSKVQGSKIRIDGKNSMDSGYQAVLDGDVVTANNLLSGNLEVIVPNYNHEIIGGVWNDGGILRISSGPLYESTYRLDGNYTNARYGTSIAKLGDFLLIGQPHPDSNSHFGRHDRVIMHSLDPQVTTIVIDGPDGIYGGEFGTKIHTHPDSSRFVVEERAHISPYGHLYNQDGTRRFRLPGKFFAMSSDNVYKVNNNNDWSLIEAYNQTDGTLRQTLGYQGSDWHFNWGYLVIQGNMIIVEDLVKNSIVLLTLSGGHIVTEIPVENSYYSDFIIVGDVLFCVTGHGHPECYFINSGEKICDLKPDTLPDAVTISVYSMVGHNGEIYVGSAVWQDGSSNHFGKGVVYVFSDKGEYRRTLLAPEPNSTHFGSDFLFDDDSYYVSDAFRKNGNISGAGAVHFFEEII